MDFQFVLPSSNSDLLNSSGDNYFVKNVYSPGEISEKLKECRHMVFQGDPFYIFDHFDTFFAVLENKNVDNNAVTNLMRSFDLLYVTVDKLGQILASVLATNELIASQERTSHLNLTKMVMYLIVNTVKKLDSIVQNELKQQTNLSQKKRGKVTEALERYPDWENKREKFLVQLYNFLQFPIEKLWSPPIVEENFVNMLCDICYRTLEYSHSRSDNNTGDTIFQIFGTAIKRYNHAIVFPIRILQLLRTIENAAPAIASGINLLYLEYNITSIFSVIIKDIIDCLAVESSDNMIARNFSTFLNELANIAPKLIIPHLTTLGDELLNCENHVLRNCILHIMGEAIIGELTGEDLNDEMKEARNEFLENLLAHINDISAHVRAKVLQIWLHLKVQDAVPLSYQLKVLRETVDRLEDKTSSVRKQALQLLKGFLERNPFSAKLTLEQLKKKHEEEVEKMERLYNIIGEERKKAEEIERNWTVLIPEILPLIEENLRQTSYLDLPESQENLEDLVKRISELLLDKKYKEAVILVRKADQVSGTANLSNALKPEEQCTYYLALLKSYIFLADGCKDSREELGTQIKTVSFLQDSIEFSKVLTKVVPKVQELLLSKINTDVFEAVDLFTTGYLFGIKGTECGMQQMLCLVWSSDKEKREAVLKAYKRVLFDVDLQGRAYAVKFVQQLTLFLENIEYGHYTAMEALVREWVAADAIDAQIVQVLFERFTMKLEGTTENESRLALQILIMASQEKHTIASANITVIEAIGLGIRAQHDPRIFTSCLEFLLNSIDSRLSTRYYTRYEPDSPLVQKVIDFFMCFFIHPRIPDFDTLAMRTLEFFYSMCQTPDVICQKIIIDLLKKFRTFSGKIAVSQKALTDRYSQQIPDSQPVSLSVLNPENTQTLIPVLFLTRYIFTVGFMTLKEMIFLDIDVYNNMKYRQELTEGEQKKKKKNAHNLMRRTGNMNMSATESLKRLSGVTAEPQQEPDEDLVGATAEDNIAELINSICEDILLNKDSSLLGKIAPYIKEICQSPAVYRDENLQQAATLTLIRFMCVSSVFCQSHMQFLMNILHHTKNVKIKCNIIIGLSDLTFRFPNVIEPWTGHIYATLHEENDELRLTSVKMISHLILHEMIRVKGQIAQFAICIVDPVEEIKNITQEFFKEIANKSNILYNVLPDIISKLSDPDFNVEEEKYRFIMRYILGLIRKDRQVETLVEKLCLRFPVTREERQWRDVAYCLSLLSYNERSIKKLIDNVQYYKDKVQIDEVYNSFKMIINNTSKLAKPELKVLLTELEQRINECLEVQEPNEKDNAADSTNVPKDPKLIIKQKKTNKQPGGRGRGRRSQTSDDTSSSEDSPKKSTSKKKRNKKNNRNCSSDETTSDENLKNNQSKSQNTKSRRKIKPQRQNEVDENQPHHSQRKRGENK